MTHGVERPDGQRPTMADVARAAGMSTALVSIVMRGVPGASDATRERITRIADELGYVPDQRARKLRQQRSRLLGVTFELQQPFHGDIVERIYAAAATHGYDVTLSAVAPSRAEHTAVDSLLRERCEALILMGSTLDAGALAELAARVPTLLVARRVDVPGLGIVRSDDLAGIGLAVDYLVELGHRRITHIDGASAPGSHDRQAGFLAAMSRHGLADCAEVSPGGSTEAAGARVTRELLDRSTPPTAVIAFNDRCATGVLDTLLHRGLRVPDDVSVVGYDDSRLATAPHLPLTTVSQDGPMLAGAAVTTALQLVAGAAAQETVLIPRLIPRATTGPPAG